MRAPHFDMRIERDTEPLLHKASSSVLEVSDNADKNTVRNILNEYNRKHEFAIASGKSDVN